MKNSEDLFGAVYESGDVVFRQGEAGDAMYIIQSGAVEVSQKQDDVENVVAVLEKGAFFGEMAILKEDKRSATVVATRRSRLLPLTKDSLLARIQDDTTVAIHILKGLIIRIQRSNLKFRQALQDTETIFSMEDEECHEDFDAISCHEKQESRREFDPTSSPEKEEPLDESDQLSKPDGGKAVDFDVSINELSEIWGSEENSVRLKVGERVFSEGEPGSALYIILDGTIEISLGSGNDKQTLDKLKSGDFFGEMAVISDCVRSATATALEPTQLMIIERDELDKKFQKAPELLMYIIQSLCFRLQRMNNVIMNPQASIETFRQSWRPLLKKSEPLKIAFICLSTCAGCPSVLLDNEILERLSQKGEIVYCPMLMDRAEIPEVDIALIDGAVRLEEDRETLEEARRKSRLLVSMGTCASFGGIPTEANRYELEELIEATYGATDDAFAYYLSGKGGVKEGTYQTEGMVLLRKAYKFNDFVKVDYYLPGCPPNPEILFNLLDELTGEDIKPSRAVVCGQCRRKPDKTPVDSFRAFPSGERDSKCFNSSGVLCMGLLFKGGCGAVCPQRGLPCWGCRGPAKPALKKLADGDSFDEVLLKALAKRCRTSEDAIKPSIKLIKKQTHNLFNFEANCINYMSKTR